MKLFHFKMCYFGSDAASSLSAVSLLQGYPAAAAVVNMVSAGFIGGFCHSRGQKLHLMGPHGSQFVERGWVFATAALRVRIQPVAL